MAQIYRRLPFFLSPKHLENVDGSQPSSALTRSWKDKYTIVRQTASQTASLPEGATPGARRDHSTSRGAGGQPSDPSPLATSMSMWTAPLCLVCLCGWLPRVSCDCRSERPHSPSRVTMWTATPGARMYVFVNVPPPPTPPPTPPGSRVTVYANGPQGPA